MAIDKQTNLSELTTLINEVGFKIMTDEGNEEDLTCDKVNELLDLNNWQTPYQFYMPQTGGLNQADVCRIAIKIAAKAGKVQREAAKRFRYGNKHKCLKDKLSSYAKPTESPNENVRKIIKLLEDRTR